MPKDTPVTFRTVEIGKGPAIIWAPVIEAESKAEAALIEIAEEGE